MRIKFSGEQKMTYFKGSKSDVLNSTVDCTVEAGEGYVTLNSYTFIEIEDELKNMKPGSMVYNKTTNKINFYNGAIWVELLTA
jgi:hypothetical protein